MPVNGDAERTLLPLIGRCLRHYAGPVARNASSPVLEFLASGLRLPRLWLSLFDQDERDFVLG
jgi:hypothetical protein